MTDVLHRRDYLATAIQDMSVPIHTGNLATANAAAGFSGHRNTARKDARALVARGLLSPLPGAGNRTYTRPESS